MPVLSGSRRQFLAGGAQTAMNLWGARAALAKKSRTRPPNIVLIVADDLGYGDIGCYGQDKIRTPNIDRLASEGMRFTDAYAGCTVCAPSRSVLMTGLHCGHTTVRDNGSGLPLRADDITVGTVLKSAGYATGCFGKWGLGDLGTMGTPDHHGFDEFFGYLNQTHAHLYYPEFLYKNHTEYMLEGNEGHRRTTYSHDVIAREALDFIQRHKEQRFFCYVPFTLPHLEWLVPEDSIAEYRGKFPEYPFDGFKRMFGEHFAATEYPLATYAAMITRLDRDVGRIMSLLKDLDIDNDTIVLFTSDNGAGLIPIFSDSGKVTGYHDYFRSNAPFRGEKQNFYEGGIRIPAIVRWPGKVRAGAVSSHAWAFCDILPTLADLAGAKGPRCDGISIAPTLLGASAGRPQQEHEFLYWELPQFDKESGRFRSQIPVQAVRMGEWKAVRSKPGGPLELYNLKQDLGEKTDLAASQPKVMARITEYLKTARTEPLVQNVPTRNMWSTYWWSKSD